jgi:hypothetical protein
MRDTARDEIRLLHQQHLELDFPPRLRGEEIAGVDMVMVDADIAGCAQVWLDSRANLDAARIQTLQGCRSDVERVLPELSDPQEVEYYGRLRDLAAAVLRAQRGWS